jgi:hypothetical protein
MLNTAQARLAIVGQKGQTVTDDRIFRDGTQLRMWVTFGPTG